MGTSGSSKGSGSGSSLVPTFVDDAGARPLPSSDQAPLPGGGDDGNVDGNGDGQAPSADGDGPRPIIVPPPYPARFAGARGHFTSFAASGGSDRPALRRAVRDYVRSGARGGGNAVRRMGSSRATAGGALDVFRGFQRDGVADTLLRFNLGDLVGKPPRDIFIGLTEVICRDGGPIDEAIARDAWLETCIDLSSIEIGDLDALTTDQIKEVFIAFVTHAIETKLFQEIGVNGFKVADLSRIEAFEAQFRDYVQRAVRDSFTSDLSDLASMSDARIKGVVDKTYRDAWDLFETWGDQE